MLDEAEPGRGEPLAVDVPDLPAPADDPGELIVVPLDVPDEDGGEPMIDTEVGSDVIATPAAKTKRRSRFDRPPPPHDWRWVVAGIGRVLISLGILMFGFVAYQLWGTAIQTWAAQNRLDNEFEEQAAALTTLPSIEDYLATLPDDPSTTDPDSTEVTTSDPTGTADTTDPTGTTDTTDPTGTTDTTTPTGETTPSTEPTTATTAPPPTGPVPTIAPGVPAPASPIPTPEPAKVIAQLRIPAIGLDWNVIEGVSVRNLREGPNHFAETPLPGQFGNSAIAGHRTTHGQPFWSINELTPGDEIEVEVLGMGIYYYLVRETQIIDPGDYAAAVPTYDPTKGTLTLVSCEPRFSTKKRIIVIADLDPNHAGGAVPTLPSAPGATTGALPGEEVPVDTTPPATADTTPAAPVDTTPATTPVTDTAAPAGFSSGLGSKRLVLPVAAATPRFQDDDDTASESEDVFSAGWFSDDGAWPHVLIWGLLLTAIALGAYWVSRKTRRNWVGALVGIIPFIIALYFFYENVNRLLPPTL